MRNLISIIIPVYRVPQNLLKNCIESCINQTYQNIEIILIDDGSPDDCGKFCEKYSNIDTRVKVIHQKNKGLSATRNRGVIEAKGDWVLFVDGDDYVDLKICEILNQHIVDELCDIVCCGYIRSSQENQTVQKLNGIKPGIYINEQCLELQEHILKFESHFSTAYCKLINKNFIEKNSLFHDSELKQGAEGIEFNIRLFEKAKKVVIIDEYLYHYVYNNNSISQTHDEKNHKFVIECFKKIKKEIEKSQNYDKLIQLFFNRMGYVIVTTAVTGYFSKNNKEKFKIKKKKFLEYLNDEIIVETLKKIDLRKIDFKRKIIILLIKYKLFFLINIMCKLRK